MLTKVFEFFHIPYRKKITIRTYCMSMDAYGKPMSYQKNTTHIYFNSKAELNCRALIYGLVQ